MSLDSKWIKRRAAELGWEARSEEFEPLIPLQRGINQSTFEWLTQLFSFSQGPFKQRPREPGAIVPKEKDWRDEPGCITSPGHQKDVAACVAFATCAVADARARIAGSRPKPLSPLYHHFCSMARPINNGADFDLLAEKTLDLGLPFAADGTESLRDPNGCTALAVPPKMHVAAFYTFETADEVKREIALHGPVMGEIDLREDFEKWYRGGIYRPTNLPVTSKHAVCLVGYNDSDQCWIGKNSMGTGWGEGGGFFRIAYGTSGVLADGDPFYSLDLL
jgi:hypothetical protein